MLSKWNRVLVAGAVSAMLAACGGGGGSSNDTAAGGGGGGSVTTAAAADKYVGVWNMACEVSGSVSENETATITKVTDTSVKVVFEIREFGNTTCSGTPATVTAQGTVTIDSQTTLTYNGAATTFDQLTLTNATEGSNTLPAFKWTGAVVNGKLVIDFEDNNTESTTAYPTNPNEGAGEYTK